MKYKLLKIRIFIEKCYMFICNKFFGIDKKKIIFESFNGKQYSDNPRAISEMLHKLDNSLRIVWLLNKEKDIYNIIPSYVKKVSGKQFNRLKQIGTSKVYVSNQGAYPNLYKNKHQMFIETWHGDRGFKKILYDANPNRPIKVYNDKVTDICLAGSEHGVNMYRSAFRYNGKILNNGSPRNDFLVNGNIKRENAIRDQFKIKNKKILLYAPTFRDNLNLEQNINVDLEKIRKILAKITKDEWAIFVRSHHVSRGFNYNFKNENIIDVSNYPDMADILLIADFLITDYSSSALDFSITGKPIILYIPDYKEYVNNCREFIVDPKKVGLFYAENEKELLSIIENKTLMDYKNASIKTNNYYKTNETGESTKLICESILDFIYNKKKVN